MKAIADLRRLRVYRVKSVKGEFALESAADIWQEQDGNVKISGLWDGAIFKSQEDLRLLAKAASLSPLEFARQELLRSPGIVVEDVQ